MIVIRSSTKAEFEVWLIKGVSFHGFERYYETWESNMRKHSFVFAITSMRLRLLVIQFSMIA